MDPWGLLNNRHVTDKAGDEYDNGCSSSLVLSIVIALTHAR